MTVVELPLAYEATRVLLPYMNDIATTEEYNRIAKAVVHKILIFNMPGGEKLVRTVSLIPSRQYAKKHYYDLSNITFKALPKDFNGYQMVMKWDQTQISTTLIENGKEAKKLILGKYTKSELQTRMKAKNWTMSADGKSLQPRVATVMSAPGTLSSIPGVDCGGSIYVPNYVWVCVTFDSGDDIADQEDCERTGHWVDDGNGTWIDLPQCADPEPPNPCDTWNTGCEGEGGGGGGGTYNPNTLNNIINNIQNNFLLSTYNQIMQNNFNNKITNVIKDIYGVSEKINLIIKDVNDLPIDKDGQTSVTRNQQNSNILNVELKLNVNELPNASREYTAATIYHECIHAILIYKNINIAQHNHMALNYQGVIKQALLDAFPNLSNEYADALAWGDLENTAAFNILPQEKKTQIRNENQYQRLAVHRTACN